MIFNLSFIVNLPFYLSQKIDINIKFLPVNNIIFLLKNKKLSINYYFITLTFLTFDHFPFVFPFKARTRI